jgi:fatty-acyl-CoA synthase
MVCRQNGGHRSEGEACRVMESAGQTALDQAPNLAEIAGPQTPPFVAETANACVDLAAVQSPHGLAVRQFGPEGECVGELGFAQLRDASCQLASSLAKRFPPRANIALWGNNSLGWIVCQLAILRMGGTVVTLDPAMRSHDLVHVLTTSQASGVLMDRYHRGNDLPALLEEVRGQVPSLGEALFIDQWRELGEGQSPLTSDPCQPDDAALIVFTSGTTGKPKGVVLHHGGSVGNAREAMRRTGLTPGAALLNPLPAYSVGGAVCITLGALATQRPQIVINHFSADMVIGLSQVEKIGWMPLVPAMLLPLVHHPRFSEADLSALEAVWMGGTVISPEHVATARQELGAKVVTIYGQTESGGVHAMNLPDASDEAIAQTVGVPLSHGRIRIASLVDGLTLKRGEIGEIRTRSPYAARGYFADPAASAELFDDEGWLRTGDLGQINDDGLLRITGRLKEMIIRGGRNIYPREIEDLLASFPGVAEVAVLGVPHPRWGEEVAVALRSVDGAPINFEAARSFVEAQVAAYKVPRLWRQVDDFPRGSQAKIRKVDMIGLFAEEKPD